MAVTTTLYATTVVSAANVTNDARATGAPNGSSAAFSISAGHLEVGGYGVIDEIGQTPSSIASVTVHLYGSFRNPYVTLSLKSGATVIAQQTIDTVTATDTGTTNPLTCTFTGVTPAQLSGLTVRLEGPFNMSRYRCEVDAVGVVVDYMAGDIHPASGTAPAASATSGAVTARRFASGVVDAVSAAAGDVADPAGYGGTAAALSGASGNATARLRVAGAAEATTATHATAAAIYPIAGTAAATSSAAAYVYILADDGTRSTRPLPRARTESWTAHVIDPDGTRHRLRLDADQPGQLTWDGDGIDAVITCWGEPPQLMEDQRVEIALTVGEYRYTFPPLVPVKDDPSYDDGAAWFVLHLIDETILLAADGLDFPKVLAAGTRVVEAMRGLVDGSAPDLHVSLPDDDPATLRNPVELALSSAPLAGINQLAETLNATPLLPVWDGGLAVEKWRPATERPVRLTFGAGETAGYEPRVDLQRFHLEAPNVVHYVADGSSEAGQIVGRWRDIDPASPYSIEARGRRILATASGDATSQEVADERARRVGLEARGRGRQATIRGAWQPVTYGHVIETGHPDEPALRGRWEVQSMAVTVGGPASDTDWTIKEVVS